jgi:hypothetical protein
MARNKPQAQPAQQQPEEAPQSASTGLPKARGVTLEAGVVDYDEERGQDVEIPIAPLVDGAPAHRPGPRPHVPHVEPPAKYVVEQGGNVVLGGHIVNLRPGKVLDPRSYDVGTLLKEPSIRLRKLEE